MTSAVYGWVIRWGDRWWRGDLAAQFGLSDSGGGSVAPATHDRSGVRLLRDRGKGVWNLRAVLDSSWQPSASGSALCAGEPLQWAQWLRHGDGDVPGRPCRRVDRNRARASGADRHQHSDDSLAVPFSAGIERLFLSFAVMLLVGRALGLVDVAVFRSPASDAAEHGWLLPFDHHLPPAWIHNAWSYWLAMAATRAAAHAADGHRPDRPAVARSAAGSGGPVGADGRGDCCCSVPFWLL